MDFFSTSDQPTTTSGKLIQAIGESGSIVPSKVTASAISMESRSESSNKMEFANTLNQLKVSIESAFNQLGMKDVSIAQQRAGVVAGMIAGDYKKWLTHSFKTPTLVATENINVVNATGETALDQRSYSLEAYDESENRNAVMYSIAYNIQAARQDEFGETFFPTITMTPDNAGFGVTVDLMMVWDGIEHKVSGDIAQMNKRNLIRAVVDPTILKKEQTRAIPVYRPASASHFVDTALIPSASIQIEGDTIATSPLKIGVPANIIALSQTDALISGGLMDQTDTLDRTISLTNVYLKVGDDIVRLNVTNLPTNNFIAASQGNYRSMNLNFDTTSVLLNSATKRFDGSALVDLGAVATSNYAVRLHVMMSGSVNIESGTMSVFANSVSVSSITDSAGNLLDITSGAGKVLADLIAGGSIIGYDQKSFRSNLNRRQRGQLIDVTKVTQLYNVPLRSPITTIHPANVDGSVDASDVQTLVTSTHIRLSNEAVTALLDAAATLNSYVSSNDINGVGPDVLGQGRYFVKATYHTENIDVSAHIDSIKSHERAADIQAVLVNKLRDAVYRMYRDSEYKAASDALNGGMAPVPTVIIGTDPVIARYLQIEGELRTLGGGFEVRIVTSLDNRVAGKMFVSFGVFDDSRNTVVNPLNFGNMVWGPELVLNANLSRGNTYSKETVVQPRYLHLVNLPVMATFTVANIPDTLSKVALNFHQV